MTTFTPLLFCALLAGSGCLVQAAEYVAEVYFVVEPQIVRNYLKLGYNNDTVMSTIKGDVEYLVYESNKYYKGMAKQGLDLEIRMKKLDILTEELYEDCLLVDKTKIQGDMGLEVFRRWLETNKIHKKHDYDMAVLWTGYDVFSEIGEDGTIGIATLGMACQPQEAIGIIEFDGTQLTASTTAHEIAHILGSDHDKTKKCDPNDGYVMSPSASTFNEHPWEFSNCSVSDITKVIEDLDAFGMNCLSKANTTTPASAFKMSSQLGRDILDPHSICHRDDKSNTSFLCTFSYLYENNTAKGDAVCRQIFCTSAKEFGCSEVAPSDGMVCDVGKRCDKGKCVTPPSDFPAPKNIVKDCIFGDSITTYNGPPEKCEDFLKSTGDLMCYDEDVYKECCETCAAKKGNTTGCEYGDKNSFCHLYDPDQVCENDNGECCFTCRNWKGKSKRSDDLLSLLQPKVTLPKQPKLDKLKHRMPIINKRKKAKKITYLAYLA